jgi:hypothetical protein
MKAKEITIAKMQNPFEMLSAPQESIRLNQSDIMSMTKDTIMFLTQIKNAGVVLEGKESEGMCYQRFMTKIIDRDLLDSRILELTEELVDMNLHIIKNFSRSRNKK